MTSATRTLGWSAALGVGAVLGVWLVAQRESAAGPGVLEATAAAASTPGEEKLSPLRAGSDSPAPNERASVAPAVRVGTVDAGRAIDELASALRQGKALGPYWTRSSTAWATSLSEAGWTLVEHVASDSDADRDRRLAALELLRHREPPPAAAGAWLEALRGAWDDRSNDGRAASGAVRALSSFGSTADRFELVAALTEEPDPSLRLAARRGLEAGPVRETAILLSECIELATAEREVVLMTLASLGLDPRASDRPGLDPATRATLADRIRGAWLATATGGERRAATAALRAVSPAHAASWLGELLGAASAAGEHGPRYVLAQGIVDAGPLPADAVAALLQREDLDERDELLVAEAAVRATGPPVDHARVAQVLERALESEVPTRQRRALLGLARLDGPDAYAAIGRALRTSEEPWLVRAALRAAGQLQTRPELQALVERLAASEDEPIRRRARQVLADWRRPGS